jgi:outer membrane protein OmpA-like peptidoglycan-associated protein
MLYRTYFWLLACVFGLCMPKLQAQDCENSIELQHETYQSTAPQTAGKQELGLNHPKSLYYFEKEHFTVWYKFTASQDCQLTFDIIPESVADDYDFLLYRCNDFRNNYCEAIRSKTLRPVRTCISRNDRKINSWTGMNKTATQEFVHSGPSVSYSKTLNVKKGDFFVLVVDNVYPNGKGHIIKIHDCLSSEILVKVPDYELDTLKPKNGNPNESTTNPPTDTLAIAKTPENIPADSLPLVSIRNPADTIPILSLEEKELEKIQKSLDTVGFFKLDRVFFHGNTSFAKPEAKNQLSALLAYMKKNQDVKIRIHSHTNGNSKQLYSSPKSPQSDIFMNSPEHAFNPKVARIYRSNSDKLSGERGMSIRNFLVNNGISKNRISLKSWGDRKMMYDEYSPNAHLNMRVEVELMK